MKELSNIKEFQELFKPFEKYERCDKMIENDYSEQCF